MMILRSKIPPIEGINLDVLSFSEMFFGRIFFLRNLFWNSLINVKKEKRNFCIEMIHPNRCGHFDFPLE